MLIENHASNDIQDREHEEGSVNTDVRFDTLIPSKTFYRI